MLTKDSEDTIRKLIGPDGREFVAYGTLPGGELICVLSCVAPDQEREFVMPSSHHESRHLVISADDPNGTGRPVRIVGHNSPKEGDTQYGWEFGGYWVTGDLEGDGRDKLNRTTVLSRT